MEPVIEHRKVWTIAGFSFYGDPTRAHAGWTHENEIGRLWQRFTGFCARPEIRESDLARAPVNYEVHLRNEQTDASGELEVFVGAETTDPFAAPVDLCLKVMPEADYAVFTLRGRQIFGGEDCPIDEWLARSGYRALPLSIQRYDERFKGIDRIEESELDFLIPLVRQG